MDTRKYVKRLGRIFAKHKRKTFLLTSLGMLVIIGSWLHYPLTQNAGSSNGYTCTRMHIYIPRRLDFKGCRTVTGVVKQIKIKPDGDSHALLLLDSQYADMLTEQNHQKLQGLLVIEDTCHTEPTAILSHFVCLGYSSPLPNPEVGKHYEITGNYVVDNWHGSWAEIHGISELKLLD